MWKISFLHLLDEIDGIQDTRLGEVFLMIIKKLSYIKSKTDNKRTKDDLDEIIRALREIREMIYFS